MKTVCRFTPLLLGVALTVSVATGVMGEQRPLFPISIEGKWGYIDAAGTVVIEPRFLSARDFSEGLAVVEIAGTSEEDRAFKRTYEGFIGPDGKFVIPPQPPAGVREIPGYDSYQYSDFHEGLARIHVNDASGMDGWIDRNGRLAIPPKFHSYGDFLEGLAYAETWRPWNRPGSQKRGFINKQGKFVITNNGFRFGYSFSGGVASVSMTFKGDDNAYCLIDKQGTFVIPPGVYARIDAPENGAAVVAKNRKVGMVNKRGEVIVPLGLYDQIYGPWEPGKGRVFVAEKKGKTFVVDTMGKEVAEVAHPGHVSRFQEGMATVDQKGRYGYVDETGAVRIALRFDDANPFNQGLARVKIAETQGYVTRQGEFVWKTDRWEEPLRNSVSQPLSTYLPDTTVQALPLSYNWQGVTNAIVFVADGDLDVLRAWYRKRCSGDLELKDYTDFDTEPGKIDLRVYRPREPHLEIFAVRGAKEVADGFVSFYHCTNMNMLRKKYPKKIVGIAIEN